MGKKKKLKKKVGSRLAADECALVVCVGKKCAPREESGALLAALRAQLGDHADTTKVRIVASGCLGVCKNGPIVATLPKVRFYKRVDAERGHELLEKLVALSHCPELTKE